MENISARRVRCYSTLHYLQHEAVVMCVHFLLISSCVRVLSAMYSNGTVVVVLTTSDDGRVTVTRLDTANKGSVIDSVSY